MDWPQSGTRARKHLSVMVENIINANLNSNQKNKDECKFTGKKKGRFFPVNTKSAGDIINDNGGIGPGFDTLRIVLAILILVYHAKQIAQGAANADITHTIIFPFTLTLVPIFFCLSGFLVTGSALRTRSIPIFLTNRSLRIFPALAVEVTLSALILGPLLTTVDLHSYFSAKSFFSYFGNIVGRVRMLLPGVFPDNPIPDIVNASLWTLQPEFYSYLCMVGLMATNIVYNKKIMTVLYLFATAWLSLLSWRYGFGAAEGVFPWHVILYYFFAGVVAYQWRMSIPVHPFLFLLAAGLSYFMVTTRGLVYLASIPVTYCMIYVGILRLPAIPLLKRGDYSYGIYLFNFPIQQSVVHFFPSVHPWWALLPISLTLTLLFAAASWHWIEKPSLSLKKRFVFEKDNRFFKAVADLTTFTKSRKM